MSDFSEKLANLFTNIKIGISEMMKEVHTSMPGIIQSFNAENQTVTVQPAIRRVFREIQNNRELLVPRNLPLCINVPIAYPRGGGYSMTFPIQKGDECLLIFSERSIKDWHKFGGIRRPSIKRFHSLSDAVAMVGVSSLPNKIPNYDASNFEIKKDDGSVSIKFTINGIEINTNNDVNVTANNVNVDASVTNLGVGGNNIARLGDSVQVVVTTGSSAGTYDGTITSAGNNTSI